MTQETRRLSPESISFIEEVIEYFRYSVSRDELHLLLAEREAWESFIPEAQLSREESEVLHIGLRHLEADLFMEDKGRIQADHLERKRFLNEYPRLKQELEGQIQKLHKLADEVDRVHRGCTISNLVGSSAGAVSSILTILGLGLAPVTAGASLTLCTTGMGLGIVSAVTSVFSSIMEVSNTSFAEAEASRRASAGGNRGEAVAEALRQNTPRILSVTNNCIQGLRNMGKSVRAIRLAKANPRLAARARSFMTAGRVSVRSGKQVQKAFGGTTLAMTRGARIMGAATAGIFLLMDVASLVEESKHLHKGAKAESAEKLRQQAQLLEDKLKELTGIYEGLKKGPTP